MRINTNVSALRAQNNLSRVNDALSKSMAKLSSGFRITRAADDAAGLGIANVLRADIRALNQASRNAEQAGSVLNIADGAAGTVQKMLERMKELAAQSASDSVDSAGRARITAEYQALRSEIDRTVATVKFQGNALLNGSFGATIDSASTVLAAATGVYAARLNGAGTGAYTFSSGSNVVTLSNGSVSQTLGVTSGAKQTLNFSALGVSIDTTASVGAATVAGTLTIGAGSGSFLVSSSGQYSGNDQITINGSGLDLRSSALTIATDPTTLANAQSALAEIDVALTSVNSAIGTIGSLQSRIETATENVRITVQNFSAAESTIRDLDMAEEMTTFTKNQILAQAGTAMLAQANQSGQSVLTLLRG
ncbi:MAG: Flagellar filament 33 kDa core protein [Gemmatimonadaceae bacterium]|nr:Flagellar filament 33 kDa core protein [Gemmatimonadaceae bacterium]